MKRQHEALKKLEKELVEAGITGGELEEMKQRAIKGTTGYKKSISESRNINKDEANSSVLE
jgi:hypothetical protein